MDDLDDVRTSLRLNLEELGFEVLEADAVEPAVEAFRTALDRGVPPELVLADPTIPGGGGGRELRESLRGIDPGLPVVSMSGYVNSSASGEVGGFAASLDKPIFLRDLIRVLGDVYRARAAAAAN